VQSVEFWQLCANTQKVLKRKWDDDRANKAWEMLLEKSPNDKYQSLSLAQPAGLLDWLRQQDLPAPQAWDELSEWWRNSKLLTKPK
jgi:hypothetical protein